MSLTKPKVAAIQMTSTPDVEQNLERAEALCRDAIADGAALVVLPECFAYLGPEDGKFAIVEPLPEGGPILKRFQELARQTHSELVLGGFYERTPHARKVRNACVHLGDDGSVRAIYRKIHLFDVDLPDGTKLEESASVEPGTEIVVTQTRLGKLGLSVCYDMRFPELYRKQVDQGATLLAVPSAFTLTTGKDHWHVLLRARAIESQCYVIAAAQTGHHFGTRRSYGHALVCDPWGCVLAECGEGEGYALASIDEAALQRVRAALPSLRHRRI
ncbi:MAG TPA: carbon-nitrogen hydrolase family protein [Polyangiales bacterium]